MIIPDRKKAVGIIVAQARPQGQDSEHEHVENVHMEALHAHAEDIIQALHNKSAEDLARALNNFLEEHDMHEESETPEDESTEHSEE